MLLNEWTAPSNTTVHEGCAGGDAAGCGCAASRTRTAHEASVARVNGVALNSPDEHVDAETLRQRACDELLRQQAVREGLLVDDEAIPTASAQAVPSASTVAAIESLLASAVRVPEPDEESARRYFEHNRDRYREGERVRARHILFAVTPSVDVAELRKRAEIVLLDARPRRDDGADAFATLAAQFSNCPSGARGGELGWLTAEDCAPEFAREIFGHTDVGVLPRLVHSRFGLHVVEVMERMPGSMMPWEAVRGAVMQRLQQQAYVTAVRQYVRLLAGAAELRGVDLDAADTPLVQ